MQTSNEMFANSSSVLTSQVQPVKNGIGFRLLDPADSAQTVALNQHSHCIQKYVLLGSQSFKECSFVGAKSVVTGGAVKTTLSMAIDPDVVSSYLSKIRTRFLIAPLSLDFHRASPQLVDTLIITLKQAFPA
jgi:hypothetical protein